MADSIFIGGNSRVAVSASGAITGDGSNTSPLAVNVDGVTVTIVGNALVAPSGGGGTIGGNVGANDNRLVRSDGTGGATIQGSIAALTDLGALSGLISLTMTGSGSGTTVLQPSATATGTLTFPSATDTLVGKATTDTLTNKTLASPAISGSASDTQVLFDDGGTIAGNTKLLFDKTDGNNQFVLKETGTDTVTGGPAQLVLAAHNQSTYWGLSVLNVTHSTAAEDGFLIYQDNTGSAHLGNGSDKIYFDSPLFSPLVWTNNIDNSDAVDGYKSLDFGQSISETTLVDGNTVTGFSFTSTYGQGGAASKGTLQNIVSSILIQGSGSGANEYGGVQVDIRADIGTGYTQSAGPVGRIWGQDNSVHGSIAVQPGTLNGIVQFINQYYNGSPSDTPAAGMWITTQKGAGGGTDATHAAANTYPVDVGLGITGTSNDGSANVGFTTGIQVGGSGSPWNEASSKIGTGLNIRDYATAAININNASATSAPSIIFDTFLQTSEMTAPSAPAANGVRIYAQDNGGGKTQLMALFSSGAAQQIAIQP